MTILKYQIEDCRAEAPKYNTRSEFAKHSTNICCFAVRNKYLDEIFQHMKVLKNKRIAFETKIF